MDYQRIFDKAHQDGLKEAEIVPDEKSDCCNADIKYTENSGVYIKPGIYCSKCNNLLY